MNDHRVVDPHEVDGDGDGHALRDERHGAVQRLVHDGVHRVSVVVRAVGLAVQLRGTPHPRRTVTSSDARTRKHSRCNEHNGTQLRGRR